MKFPNKSYLIQQLLVPKNALQLRERGDSLIVNEIARHLAEQLGNNREKSEFERFLLVLLAISQ